MVKERIFWKVQNVRRNLNFFFFFSDKRVEVPTYTKTRTEGETDEKNESPMRSVSAEEKESVWFVRTEPGNVSDVERSYREGDLSY